VTNFIDLSQSDDSEVILYNNSDIVLADVFGMIPEGGNTVSGIGNIASGETWGTLTFTISNVIIPLVGIETAEAWGSQSIQPVIELISITTAEAWGTMEVNQNALITGIGNIASAEVWGTQSAVIVIALIGIASAEAWGTPITKVYYNPVSRIVAGGFSNNRPTQVVVLP